MIIIAPAPTNSTRLRKATDTAEPTADLICVVSAVSRDIISPVCALSKNAADRRVRCANTSLRKIRDDPFAERRDEIEPKRTRKREHGGNADHHAEIAVDQVALAGKSEIDHAPDGERNRERRQSRDGQCDEREENADAVAQHDKAAAGPAGAA